MTGPKPFEALLLAGDRNCEEELSLFLLLGFKIRSPRQNRIAKRREWLSIIEISVITEKFYRF